MLGLLREASAYRMAALLFEYPDEAWRARVAALAPDLGASPLGEAAREALANAEPGLWLGLFGPGGPVSLREATYQGGVQLGYLMAELAARYEAFGYQPETQEPADHLSVMAGFLAYLKLKQAYAVSCEDEECSAVTEAAAADFLKEHLASVAGPVAERLAGGAPRWLAVPGNWLLEQAGPAPSSTYPLGGDVDEEMNCGAAANGPELIQLT
jgi:nitrate reductase assembly molybdenum cofactor insertion protein NarJ